LSCNWEVMKGDRSLDTLWDFLLITTLFLRCNSCPLSCRAGCLTSLLLDPATHVPFTSSGFRILNLLPDIPRRAQAYDGILSVRPSLALQGQSVGVDGGGAEGIRYDSSERCSRLFIDLDLNDVERHRTRLMRVMRVRASERKKGKTWTGEPGRKNRTPARTLMKK
jgi:hypothetical protein